MSHGHGGGAHSDEHHRGKPDRDLLDVISTLTHHLTGLGKVGSGGTSERGVGAVTLAGSNDGAVMKAELLDEAKKASSEEAKLNSNCQTVNNSIMIDGRCEAEDPGVDIEIVDCDDDEEEEEGGGGGGGGESSDDGGEHEKKKKKKEKKESLHEEK